MGVGGDVGVLCRGGGEESALVGDAAGQPLLRGRGEAHEEGLRLAAEQGGPVSPDIGDRGDGGDDGGDGGFYGLVLVGDAHGEGVFADDDGVSGGGAEVGDGGDGVTKLAEPDVVVGVCHPVDG